MDARERDDVREPFLGRATPSAPPLETIVHVSDAPAQINVVSVDCRAPSAPPSPLLAEQNHPSRQSTHAVGVPSTLRLPRHSTPCHCPTCGSYVQTEIHYRIGTWTWISALFMAFLSFGALSCIPFCIHGLKDVRHDCPICRSTIYISAPTLRRAH